ncbi:MAG: YfhO family protein [Muricomes sp.]
MMNVTEKNKGDYWKYTAMLLLIAMSVFFIQISQGRVAGAKVDWISQHVVFPDYFRNLFYKTHNFFPQYASEIGGGQNIYNFAYYGLGNPCYWIAYLFPFITMEMWVQILSAAAMGADGFFCFC